MFYFYFQTTIDPSLDCTFGERFLTLNANRHNQNQIVEFPIDFKWPVKQFSAFLYFFIFIFLVQLYLIYLTVILY